MSYTPTLNINHSLEDPLQFVNDAKGSFEDVGDDDGYIPAKNGVRANLREGELRVTCVIREDQSKVLHDWGKTAGRTFREVCISMAEHYITNVISVAAAKHKLNCTDGNPPEDYAYLYGEQPDDCWAEWF